MKCTVCDRCGNIISDEKKYVVLTCAKPLKELSGKPVYRADDPQFNDILWTKDLCMDCLTAIQEFISASESSDSESE